MNVESIKKIMTEKKTTLPSQKVKVETEKANYYQISQTDYIPELKELIYAGENLVYKKINVPQRNLNRNTKSWWEIILGQVKK